MKGLLTLAALLPGLALCQTNLKFQEGAARQVPPGWFLLDAVKDSGYSAEWRSPDACRNSLPCAVLTAPPTPPPQSFGTLMQSFDATPYRGKMVRLRAWIRLDPKADSDHAQMLLHVGRPNFQEGFVDNMADRPVVSAEWRRYEIHAEVAPDADTIRIGLMLYGQGRAWMSDVDFGPPADETAGASTDAARAAIAKQYARMDSAFVRGDPADIRAIVLPDAQMRVGTIREPLLPAIEAEMAKGSQLSTRTQISSVRMDGSDAIVLAHREARDPQSNSARSVVTTHRDSWTQSSTGWRLAESIEVSYHWVLPSTSDDAARPVVAELRKRAVPLSGSDDLAAFGAAVADARVVALGEAVHGSREFRQLKQRLLEYLVKEKGFTMVTAASEADLPSPHVAFAPFVDDAGLVRQSASAKIVWWTDNTHARDPELRQKLGRKLYVAGFAFHHGEVRAVGVEGGESRGLHTYATPVPPAGWGDSVLDAAAIPQFFLNLQSLPGGPLARWLSDMHLFRDLGAYWVLDDPDASLQPLELSRNYDGLFFIEELHVGE
jgi:hypothetical protein